MKKKNIDKEIARTIKKVDKIEKEKLDWIMNNLNIPCIVASKGEKRGEITYEEWK